MKHSIKDDNVKTFLEYQLKLGKAQLLEGLTGAVDYAIEEHVFAIYSGTISKQVDDSCRVIDVWLIVGCGASAWYNRDDYPDLKNALEKHIGALVVDGKMKIKEVADDNGSANGSTKKRRRKSKPERSC